MITQLFFFTFFFGMALGAPLSSSRSLRVSIVGFHLIAVALFALFIFLVLACVAAIRGACL